MNEVKNISKNKGGRPRKIVQRDLILSVKCSNAEKKTIQENAKLASLTVSEYLRTLGISGKVCHTCKNNSTGGSHL